MSVRCRGWISFAVAAILSRAIVPAAHAAFGFQDLLRDKRGSVRRCTPAHDSLDGAWGVAVSPDGNSVYVASWADDSITRFGRTPLVGTDGAAPRAGRSI
jgi:hypothetical protein